MKDYIGDIGFRVSEKDKTVQVIWKAAGEWRTWGELRHYPVNESTIPNGPVSVGGMWEFAWALLNIENIDVSKSLIMRITDPLLPATAP